MRSIRDFGTSNSRLSKMRTHSNASGRSAGFGTKISRINCLYFSASSPHALSTSLQTPSANESKPNSPSRILGTFASWPISYDSTRFNAITVYARMPRLHTSALEESITVESKYCLPSSGALHNLPSRSGST